MKLSVPVFEDPIVFVLGVARSGTTLLRLMLAGHSRLFCPPEMVLAPFETMAERHALLERRFWEKGGLRRTFIELEGLEVPAAKQRVAELHERSVAEVYALLNEGIGERVLVDKCPHLVNYPDALRRLARWFPNARFLWIVRNPGSVIRSLHNVNMSEALFEGSAYTSAEQLWRGGNQAIASFVAELPARSWLRFRYEDLVTAPEATMRDICALLGVDYEPALVQPYAGDRMRSGPKGARAVGDPNTALRSEIDPELATRWLAGFDHRSVDAQTKALARGYGYELDEIPLPGLSAVSDAMAQLFAKVVELEQGIGMPDDLHDLEARRFLMRMLAATVETFTEYGDPDHPSFHHVIGPTRKMFGDCPDSDVVRARLRLGPGRSYRISGRIPPGTVYVGALLHRRGGKIGAHCNDAAITRDEEGRFELRVSADEIAAAPGVTPLRGEGDETEIVIRQYFGDRRSEAPIELDIELLGDPIPAAPLTPERYAKGLQHAGRMLATTVERSQLFHKFVTAGALPIKQFHSGSGERLFPTPDNDYRICWYRFGPEQAFVIRGALPKARYFSLCLYNAWLESFDYTRHTICLNHTQLRTNADGEFSVVLAERDPGVPNWLDTAGHHAGFVLARALLLDGEAPALTTETLWLKDLA
ncbi:Sulfotransferase domain protein [Enhygromyxa salina]|uniref:Sulfotransferase domain protein n=1 Tax=Enhygromyxa salina TaxID=215803 RepID=A0A2S9XKH3_9BACT|nr:sulfotransferase [Enhygromyxa salina]PRP93230.1 Sulfotransferase domain protein [Enhygromyxa salina]